MASNKLTIVIGTGYVGRRVLAAMPAGDAIGLSRSPLDAAQPMHRYDLDAGGQLPVDLPDEYAVLYTVAPAATSEYDVRLERLLAELNAPPQRFVYISTTGVYGDRRGALVNEESELNPMTTRARRRVAAERALQSWGNVKGVRICILRVPGIYGPGRLGTDRIRDGSPVIRESEANPGNRIHADDLAACCLAALDNAEADGIFNVGDGDSRSSTWFAQEVARQAGFEPPPEISWEEARESFSRQRLSFLSESRRIDTRRMREALGIMPRYANAEDGIRASLAEQEESTL